MNEEHITRIFLDDKEYILVGTAHVSKTSAELVKEVIEKEQPDSVCVELDRARYESITEGNKWKDTDIFKVIKEKKAGMLFINLALSAFQKKIANQLGVKPGQEMIQAIESAEENGAKLVLADRNIQVTFSRIWRSLGWRDRMMLLTQTVAGMFTNEEITEEELEKLKSKDTIDAILNEFTEKLPQLKKPLIDERDQYLSHKIKHAPGKKVVAVLGAAHVPGVAQEIHRRQNIRELTKVPPKSKKPKVIGWLIPLLIIAVILYTFLANPEAGMRQTASWVIWHCVLSALGAAVARAHPLAVITAGVAAPFTALNPLLAAGWFAGFVQAFMRKPTVRDFERLSEDITSVKGFWRNKVTRILLVVILANIGSSLATFISGFDILRVFFRHL